MLVAARLHADEQLQQVQQSLKDQGFYYGLVDGEPGTETNAAVRRYQIRNGLEVTGKLNAETLAALHIGASSAPANEIGSVRQTAPPPAVAPPPSVKRSDEEFLRNHPEPAAPPAAPTEESSAPIEQVESVPAEPDLADFFRKTPYAQAPIALQRDTLKRAQVRLAHEGFFRGEVDGVVSAETQKAIVHYQHDADLSQTGRLDMATLADMDLLPNRRFYADPPVRHYYDDDEPVVRTRRVYRGIWVH